MNLTVDASVFVAAARVEEAHYSISRQFLRQARSLGATLVCPTLILPECAAAVARPTGDAVLAQELVDLVEGFPGLQLVPLEVHLAREAVQVATTHRLRGADSLYIAVAAAFQAALITWDTEMLERGSEVVDTSTPSDWIEALKMPD
jgi:predicted nucleic acid-binding protein